MDLQKNNLYVISCQVLSIDSSMVTPDANLIDLGMDSISAMTMISQIARETQVRLPAILFVSGEPSPQSISQAISDAIDGKLDVSDDGQTLKIEEIEEELDKSVPVSPIEAHQLSWYKCTSRKQSMHGTVDIPIPPEHANLASVRAAIFTVLAMHPSTRSVFNESHNNPKNKFKRSILNPDEIFDLRVLEDELDGNRDKLRDMSEEEFDTERAGPIRFIFTQKPAPVLRMVLHKVGFDFKSTSVLVQDLIDSLDRTYVPEESMELVPIEEKNEEKHEEMNELNAELEKVYKERADEHYRFWEQLGHKNYGLTSLGKEDAQDITSSNGMVTLALRPALIDKLKNFIYDRKVCLLGVVVSCHQLLLHALTGKKTIPLIFPLDLRLSLGKLGEMGSYCNEIPLVAEFNSPQTTLQDFILSNTKAIQAFVDHGTLPFTMFSDMSDRILSLFNETPHSVCIEKLDESGNRTNTAVTLPSNSETHLDIKHNLAHDTVLLTLTYHSTALNKHKAWLLLKCLSRLINKGVARPKMTVARAETQCKQLRKKLRKQKLL